MDKQEFADFVLRRYQNDPNGRLGRQGEKFIESEQFTIEVTEGVPNRMREGVIGTSFGSTQDYGRTYNAIHSDDPPEEADITTVDELKEKVRKRIKRVPRQIDFVKKEGERRNKEVTGVYTGVLVVLTKNGYSILPNEDEVVTPSK